MNTQKHSWYTMAADANEPTTANISILGEIGYWGITAKDFHNDLLALGDVEVINLTLNSPGGEVFDGLYIHDALKAHKATVNVYVSGLAASMGSIIALAGDTVSMSENSYFMVHKPSIWGFEDVDFDELSAELQKKADLLRNLETTFVNIYTENTGQEEAEIRSMLEEITWLNAAEAKEKGFVTTITEPVSVAANFAALERIGVEMPADVKAKLMAIKKAPQPKPQPSIMDRVRNALGLNPAKGGLSNFAKAFTAAFDTQITDSFTRENLIENLANASGETSEAVTEMLAGETPCTNKATVLAFSQHLPTTVTELQTAAEADGIEFKDEEELSPAQALAAIPTMLDAHEALTAQVATLEATIETQNSELLALGKKPAAKPTSGGGDNTNKKTSVADAPKKGSTMAAAQAILNPKT